MSCFTFRAPVFFTCTVIHAVFCCLCELFSSSPSWTSCPRSHDHPPAARPPQRVAPVRRSLRFPLVCFVCSGRCCVTAALRARFPLRTWQRSWRAGVVVQVLAPGTRRRPIRGLLLPNPTAPVADLFAVHRVFLSYFSGAP